MTSNPNPQSVLARSTNHQLRDLHSPPPLNHASASPPSKRDLTSWWKQFKRNAKKEEEKAVHYPGIFGVPLNVSIKYANVAISLTDDKGDSFIYGYVPIVVAKCGVYLKEKATDVEGIFRLSGSAKRIKDLQEVFNSPDRYGKGLDWTGYTVHDAANILRRYLNQLPEPIVPLDFYDRFRDPLRGHQTRSEGDNDAQASAPVDFDHDHAVATYQKLIKALPSLNRQLLLYILDLLAVFSSKSEQNRMNSANLAAIFQPGLLSHPSHDMAPEEYRLSQDVLIFLIENQDNFLFGMTGTAADEQTVKELEGGTIRPPTSRSNIRRSASNASAGADSLRKYETTRRNISVSSKHSDSGNVPSPVTPNSVIGVQRSNTVPSKRPVKVPSPRFDKSVEAATPGSSSLAPPAESYGSSQSGSRTPPQKPDPATSASATESGSIVSTPVSAYPPHQQTVVGTETLNSTITTGLPSSGETVSARNPQSRVSSPQPLATPTKERKISSFFTKSPPGDHERNEMRQPNKLRKKQRIPGSASESAHSSTNSLQGSNADFFAAISASHTPWGRSETGSGSNLDFSHTSTPKVSSSAAFGEEITPQPNRETKRSSTGESNAQPSSDNTLKVNRSRTPSLHSRSSVTDQSDMDQLDEATKAEKKENRRSWRFHKRSKKSTDQFALALATSPPHLGTNPGAEFSSSSIGSSNRPTKSITNDSQQPGTDTSGSGLAISMAPQEPNAFGNNHTHLTKSDNAKDPMNPMFEPEKKSFFGKFKARVAQVKEGAKERDDKERAKSPPPPQSEMEKAVSTPNLAAATKDNLPSQDAPVDSTGENRLANHEPASAAVAPSPTPTPASAPAAVHPVIPEEPSLKSKDPEPAHQSETKPDTIPEEPAETEMAQEQTPVVSVTPAVASMDIEPPSSPPSTVVEATSSTAQEAPDSTPVVSQQVQSTS